MNSRNSPQSVHRPRDIRRAALLRRRKIPLLEGHRVRAWHDPARGILSDCRHDRRIDGYRGDETSRTGLGVPDRSLAWQRLLVMVAGVLFNFLLAIPDLCRPGICLRREICAFPGCEYGNDLFRRSPQGRIPKRRHSAVCRRESARQPCRSTHGDGAGQNRERAAGNDTVDISIPEKFIFALDKEAQSDTATINFMAYRFRPASPRWLPAKVRPEPAYVRGTRLLPSTVSPRQRSLISSPRCRAMRTAPSA